MAMRIAPSLESRSVARSRVNGSQGVRLSGQQLERVGESGVKNGAVDTGGKMMCRDGASENETFLYRLGKDGTYEQCSGSACD